MLHIIILNTYAKKEFTGLMLHIILLNTYAKKEHIRKKCIEEGSFLKWILSWLELLPKNVIALYPITNNLHIELAICIDGQEGDSMVIHKFKVCV